MRWRIFIVMFLLGGCATHQKKVRVVQTKDIHAIQVQKSYSEEKEAYSITKTIKFKPDRKHFDKGIALAKQGIHYEVPERKLVLQATIWDTPLIKSFLQSHQINPRSNAAEELRKKMLQEHTEYTQFVLSIKSHGGDFFDWENAQMWLEDTNKKKYFPIKVRQITNYEVTPPETSKMLSKITQHPGTMITHDHGTLYFKKINLAAHSPIRLSLFDSTHKRKVEFDYNVRNLMPQFHKDLHVAHPPPPADPPARTAAEIMKLKKKHFALATHYYKNENFAEAIQEWKKVLELDPYHKLSKIKMGKAEQARDQKRAAQMELSAADKKRKMKVHFLIASEHYKNGEFTEAIQEWNNVLAFDPEHTLSQQKIEKAQHQLETLTPE